MKAIILMMTLFLTLNSAWAATDGAYNFMGSWKSYDNRISFIYDGIDTLTVKMEESKEVLKCSTYGLDSLSDKQLIYADQLLLCSPVENPTKICQVFVKLISENPSTIIEVVTNLPFEEAGSFESITFRRL